MSVSRSKNIVQSDIDAIARLQKLGVNLAPNFEDMTVKNVTFKGINFDDDQSGFRCATLEKVKFVDCTFQRYNDTFSGAKLKKVSFDKATVANSTYDGERATFNENFLNDEVVSWDEKPLDPDEDPRYAELVKDGRTVKKITVYKKVYTPKNHDAVIAPMTIDKGTRVVMNPEDDGKCRAEKVTIVSLVNAATGKPVKEAVSGHDHSYTYKAGEVKTPEEEFDDNQYDACCSGIHFFLDRESALHY